MKLKLWKNFEIEIFTWNQEFISDERTYFLAFDCFRVKNYDIRFTLGKAYWQNYLRFDFHFFNKYQTIISIGNLQQRVDYEFARSERKRLKNETSNYNS